MESGKESSKMCRGCPFNYTSEESAQAQNYGCLPSSHQILEKYENNEEHWKCHGKKKRCGGLTSRLIEMNPPKEQKQQDVS